MTLESEKTAYGWKKFLPIICVMGASRIYEELLAPVAKKSNKLI